MKIPGFRALHHTQKATSKNSKSYSPPQISECHIMPKSVSFDIHLFIQGVKFLTPDNLEDCNNGSYMVQIEWRGSRRTKFLLKGFLKNRTTKQKIQRNGTLSWNEGFDHTCKLKQLKNDIYRSWIINLEIKEIDQNARGKISSIGKAKVDIAEFALLETEKSIKVPINCNIKGQAAEAELMIKLRFSVLKNSSSAALNLPRAVSLRAFSSTTQTYNKKFQYPRTGPARNDSDDFSSDGEPDFNYGKLAITNFLLVGQFDDNEHTKEIPIHQPVDQNKQKQQPSLIRLLSRSKSKSNYRGPPLLTRETEDGGDDIDTDRRHQLGIRLLKQTKVQPEESFQPLRFEDENLFEVGKWEKRKIVSRDGEMEVITDIFFASIDQRSDKAAGGGACTVLATIIAHWLHDNPNILPLRCQFDEIICEGSSEWRKLCENEYHKEKFSDQHFDLETVLEAKVRPLAVVTDKSYVGFFSEFLEGVMSFDSVWSELVSIDAAEERVYVASWNDHFFVLKVESDAIYMIDTLGERLFEGCNQAYILKFDNESVVYRSAKGTDECKKIGPCEDHAITKVAFCKGVDSCKEYIKGFLAAIPLKELQYDMERGLVEETTLHRRLQIEFHYTTS